MVRPLAGTAAGRQELDIGAGGDRTMEVDRQAELAVMAGLEDLAVRGERFSLLSEEIGLRSFGAPFPLVLLDPVDGSVNAKRGLPVFATMLALATGPKVADVCVGHVRNLATGTSWDVGKGMGFQRDGHPVEPLRPAIRDGRFEAVGLESTSRAILRAMPLVELTARVRIIGSMALSLAHTAAGHLDLFAAPVPARLFDMAAGLLMLRESGGSATDVDGAALDGLQLDLTTRTTLVVSSAPAAVELALAALRRTEARDG